MPKNSPARALYEVLRKVSPSRTIDGRLQGKLKPAVGDKDPSYPGGTIGKRVKGGPKVSADHIESLAEIMHKPGFLKLPADYMFLVVNSRVNLQWLSFEANMSKQSRSVAQMVGVDPVWQVSQVVLEKRVRQRLLDMIRKLNESLGDR